MLDFSESEESPLGDVNLRGRSSVDVLPRDVFEEMEAASRVGVVDHKGLKRRFMVGRSELRLCGMPQSLSAGSLVGCEGVESSKSSPVVNAWCHAL
jgi:hypothetical protein